MIDLKKFGIASLLVGGVIFISGCGQANTIPQNGGANKNNFPRSNSASSTEKFFNMGTKATLADLVVGKKITVMGTTNSDGTVSAKRIMIGEPGGFMMRGATSTTSTGENFRPGNLPNDAVNNPGQQPVSNGGQFNGQNRGQMGAGGQRPNGGRMMGGNGMVSGEIISKDDTSLVIKNQAGGSKIVFYSDKTEIFLFQPPTSTPATPTTTLEKK